VRKNNNTSLPVSFKNRNLLGYKKSHLRFGNLGLKFDKNYTIEKLHLVVLKKKFKFFLKKKKKISTKAWFFISENFPIYRKGKNARMGKGKGIYQRMAFRVKKNQIFLEFRNLNYMFLKKLSNNFYLTSNLHNTICAKDNKYLLQLSKTPVSFYKLYYRF
jgi:ribosomal protein L16/L10AE